MSDTRWQIPDARFDRVNLTNSKLYAHRSQMNGKVKFEFTDKAWQHPSPAGWFFVSLPVAMAEEIRAILIWHPGNPIVYVQ